MTDEQPTQPDPDPEYQRGVYGVHGDSVHRIFVLQRLMRAVQPELVPTYRVDTHWHDDSAAELLEAAAGTSIVVGVNPGLVADPSHVLIGAWEGFANQTPLRLLRRLELHHTDLEPVIRSIVATLDPFRVMIDRTGVGLAVVRNLNDLAPKTSGCSLADRIGPNLAIDAATVTLKSLVDDGRIVIPDDHPLIDQMNGQTYTLTVPEDDSQHPERVYAAGDFDVFNTLRLLVLAAPSVARAEPKIQVDITADTSAFRSAIEAMLPPGSLYDIGRFLSHSLNLTVEQAREFVDRCKAAFPTAERDQDHLVEVPYDWWLDLAEGFDRLVAMWEDDQHVLVLTEDPPGWSIEHSLRCRAGGNMAGCRYHQAVAGAVELGTELPEPGRWTMGLDVDVSDDITFEPAP